ncbi:hypothetical protein E5672_15190 [Alteromonas portus]|uniref:Lipoprotein n=1 Tax=Alteromonas portus TaxID=2565549 RepID=A0A4U0ZK43_9ALTE|nr:hypothetical protein [Alteromonas portus]TKB02442.1 hypothetical protein E5672_15190 [Alteromonas portus]
MRILLVASVIFLTACDSTEIAHKQPEANSGGVALYDAQGFFVRQYQDAQDCHAAAIRHNMRAVNNNTENNNTYRRAGIMNEPRLTSSCREV